MPDSKIPLPGTALPDSQFRLLDHIPDAVVVHDMGFKIQYVNRAAVQLYGWTSDEMVGRLLLDTIPLEVLRGRRSDVAAEIHEKGRWHGEVIQTRKDGGKIRVLATVSAVKDEHGKTVGRIGVNRDLTGHEKVETRDAIPGELQREKAKKPTEQDRLFNLSQDLICIANLDGYFTYINPALEQATGYSRQKLQENPIVTFVHPDDREKTAAELDKLASGQVTVDFENRYLHADGSVRHISWVATPLVEEGQIYSIGRDITRQKEAAEQIEEYQLKLRALASELTLAEENERRRIASDLHDHIGHSLALARIQLGKILESGSDTEKTVLVNDISNILLEALQETKNLIFDLSSPTMNELGIAAAISDWLEEFIERRHGLKTILIDRSDDKPEDHGLRAILFRNTRELLTNVVKHARAQNVQVVIENGPDAFRISVADDGIGCDDDHSSRMGKKESGFGLFSIRERLADFGGELHIRSEPGKGCEAIMTIPAENMISGGTV